jgi:hypothetical protein
MSDDNYHDDTMVAIKHLLGRLDPLLIYEYESLTRGVCGSIIALVEADIEAFSATVH